MFSFVRNDKNVLLWYSGEDLFTLEEDLKLADMHMSSQDKLIIDLHPELQCEQRFD